MAGGWVGYVYALVGCGAFTGIVLASAIVLVAWGRMREGRGMRVRVTSVSHDASRGDAA